MSKFAEDIDSLLDKSTRFWLLQQIRLTLKKLRSERGLTQAEVAEKMGKDQVFVSNCESGRRRLDPIELLAFATAYEISVEDILNSLDLEEAKKRDYGPFV
ncbi:MAG: helix-turn-helix domain-containing protein [bacterium]